MFKTLFWNRVAISCFCLSVCHPTHSIVYFYLFVSGRRAPFNISCNIGLVVVNSLSFHLKTFISPSYVNSYFAGCFILVISLFQYLSILLPSLLACNVSAGTSMIIWWGLLNRYFSSTGSLENSFLVINLLHF